MRCKRNWTICEVYKKEPLSPSSSACSWVYPYTCHPPDSSPALHPVVKSFPHRDTRGHIGSLHNPSRESRSLSTPARKFTPSIPPRIMPARTPTPTPPPLVRRRSIHICRRRLPHRHSSVLFLQHDRPSRSRRAPAVMMMVTVVVVVPMGMVRVTTRRVS